MNTKKSILVILLACFCLTGMEAQLLKKIKGKRKGKKLELFQTEESGGPLYDKYKGKVVFSTSEIEREDPESKYISTYTLGNTLYIRSYLTNSVVNSMMEQLLESGEKAKDLNSSKTSLKIKSRLRYKLYFDGKMVSKTNDLKHLESDDRASLLSLRATLNDKTNSNYSHEGLYQSLLLNEDLLTPGKHTLKIELTPWAFSGPASKFEFKPIATGEIELIIEDGASYVKLDECFPKAKMTDATIEKEISQVINSNIVKGSTLNDVIISSPKWTILTNVLRQPIKKSLRAILVFTDAEGTIFYTERIFEKVFDGVEYSSLSMSSDINIQGEGAADTSPHIVSSKCAEVLKK